MMSRSYTNLLDLAEGNFAALGPAAGAGGGGRQRQGSFGLRRMSRVMTVPGTLSELDGEDESEPAATSSVASDAPSSVAADRLIVVSNQLPIVARRRPDGRGWSFVWDDDSLLLQLRDGIPEDMEVLFVGSLRADVPVAEQDEVSQALLDRFRCAPVFLPDRLNDRFYHGFCKRQLWPLFHYMLPFSSSASAAGTTSSSSAATCNGRFDRSAWEAYVLANKFFFEKVVEVINPEDDYVWVHDYHLMALPTFLRRCFNRLRIGFFLHSPFPSSEIYRTLPVREEILKALLNCDLIGFHTFDYARHFLSCCSRMLGIEYQSKRGYIELDYFGRTVGIKIMPVGVHMGQLELGLRLPDREWRLSELQRQFQGKTVLLGVDDMDIFKGINLKLLAFENMLRTHPKWQGRAVLVQIANPARGRGKDLEAIQAEIEESCQRINGDFGQSGYSPVVFIGRDVSSVEKIAYYTIAECVVVTAVRDGMNLTPYEYVVCRQGAPGSQSVSEVSGPKKSMLVVSEFIGCSPSLSGAIRVNPWNIEATAEAMNEAISMPEQEKQLRHEKHYRYVRSHDVAYWSKSFIIDLERVCKDHFKRTCWGIGLGFGFRVVALDPHFTKLNMDSIINAYELSESRAILLDYDGTLVPQTSLNKEPSPQVLSIINTLCSDSRNIVFLVSGRDKDTLGKWFSSCPRLGIAAEHGYFLRWSREEEWQTCTQALDFGWMQMAKPVMNLYTEATDGSYIEAKESALVWHHQDADLGFGSSQAKEMLDHLESVLANEPVSVKSGQFIVEVKPQGISKGIVAERILASVKERGKQADFLLCIGDDRSDEDMFENIADIIGRNLVAPRTALFACTVGQKPSKAKFYLDDTFEVVTMLSALADATGPELETDSADESVAYISSLDIGDEQSESSDKPVEGS
ncbi:probable alpha,alpha-trehalose-phosphate synthase [UDP-forming] 7 [Zea mays]|uniref:alpha,alpha-trehalose-phosphate synthase (UDP-forming) n=5 Tax=Zea mays TaxID=4577 RepID=C0PDN0_MAIZE|nr:probable alpha,alpha-trehalose-phosphate synthase [UDP-forming] 7 [Zea mays]ACN33296.1 unknown [Zea mays]AQL00502.1 trehalose-6-phosphate synthase15 [Zea mays]AQL00505.1 trehalose-6-phosphate synthase15 [Zea mays]AQL00507.1 trehalose-6-phosphate synthase15 [Zea mays]AQL00508.1 trehalose-6-phosphate synthase15 [Zea mays]|eukprot:NP_001288502.1 probable alpha,alpha-trehalose-phosphate synthase [UDP-forming] 7 [Zea mays]